MGGRETVVNSKGGVEKEHRKRDCPNKNGSESGNGGRELDWPSHGPTVH